MLSTYHLCDQLLKVKIKKLNHQRKLETVLVTPIIMEPASLSNLSEPWENGLAQNENNKSVNDTVAHPCDCRCI